MLSVEEALARILAAFQPLPAETVSLQQALGRVLAADVVSRLTQPPSDVSAMDGYAVRAADLGDIPSALTEVGEAPAGSAYEAALHAGQTVRIFTGGPLPAGADAIVIQENTEQQGDQVLVKESVTPGTYVRPAGLDFKSGEVGITAGRRLTARDIGLAAAMNVPWLRVRRRPRVAVLSTGNELVLPGDPLGPNQIVSSNGFSLAALVEACGGEALHLGIAPDDPESLIALATSAHGADLLVTSGGASVGKHDLIRSALSREGLELDFWKIAMRPGKPLIFGQLKEVPLLGLPGNPVSSLVCATIFLKPAIERLLGRPPETEALETAILGAPLPENDRRQEYMRAQLTLDTDGRRVARPFPRQDSSMLATLAKADCLIMRPPHAPAAPAGEPVQILPLPGASPAI